MRVPSLLFAECASPGGPKGYCQALRLAAAGPTMSSAATVWHTHHAPISSRQAAQPKARWAKRPCPQPGSPPSNWALSRSSAAHHSPRRAFSKFADNVGHGIAARAWSNLRLQEHQCTGQAHCMPHTHWYSRAIRPSKPALGGVPCTCLSRLLFSWHLLNVQLCVWTIC